MENTNDPSNKGKKRVRNRRINMDLHFNLYDNEKSDAKLFDEEEK